MEPYENNPVVYQIEAMGDDAELYKIRLKHGYKFSFGKNDTLFSHSMDVPRKHIGDMLKAAEVCYCKDCARSITARVLENGETEPYMMDWVKQYEKRKQ